MYGSKAEIVAVLKNYVNQQRERFPNLKGAYVSGSFLEFQEGEWPESSDVDLVLVFCGSCPEKIGKLREQGLLLEVTCMGEESFTPSHVLSTHYLAYALSRGEILFEKGDFLSALHGLAAREWMKEEWVTKRVGGFSQSIRRSRESFSREAPWCTQCMSWIFPTGIACFPILTAAGKNCTVRKRYPAVREVLEARGMGEVFEMLSSLLAPRPLSRNRLLLHLESLEDCFSLAAQSRGGSEALPYRRDISPEGRQVALDGSRELVLGEHPMDAAFWMGVTFARCGEILLRDCPSLYEEKLPLLQSFFRDLGISDSSGLEKRFTLLADSLPRVESAAFRVFSSPSSEK